MIIMDLSDVAPQEQQQQTAMWKSLWLSKLWTMGSSGQRKGQIL